MIIYKNYIFSPDFISQKCLCGVLVAFLVMKAQTTGISLAYVWKDYIVSSFISFHSIGGCCLNIMLWKDVKQPFHSFISQIMWWYIMKCQCNTSRSLWHTFYISLNFRGKFCLHTVCVVSSNIVYYYPVYHRVPLYCMKHLAIGHCNVNAFEI